jgi:two-component system, OmpR family, phosphate regulon sensor histidine kinase PhoR
MKNLSYIKKLAIPYVLIITGLLLAVAIVTSNYFENFLLNNWENELNTEAKLASGQLSYSNALKDPAALAQLVESLAESTGNRVTIILPDGMVIGESARDPGTMENHLARPEIQSALAGQTTTVIRTSSTLHTRLLYSASPLVNNGEVVAIIRFAKPASLIDETIIQYKQIIYLIALAGILICLSLMFLQSGKRSNPLMKLSSNIKDLSLGNLNRIEQKARNDEIGIIISSFNSMVSRISLQIATIQDERKKMNAILTNMKDGVVLVNKEGNVTLINPAAQDMFEIAPESAVGGSLVEVVRQYQVINLWKESKEMRSNRNALIQISTGQDSIQASASPIEENSPGDVLLLFQDLTLLRKLQTIRQDFVSNVSHELRTPLASLKVLVETLLDGALKDPKAADHFLQQMNGEVDNLTQIVQELLELSKIESGKVPLERVAFHPSDLILPAIERMQLQADRGGIVLSKEIPDDLPVVSADSKRIQQVLVNLIHNAIKFTNPGGKITVSAKAMEQTVLFKVADTGIGISSDDLDRIFERFYKTDRARASGGTGLGLSIARHIIEGHGGKIWAESQPGRGSTFIFSLPVTGKSLT